MKPPQVMVAMPEPSISPMGEGQGRQAGPDPWVNDQPPSRPRETMHHPSQAHSSPYVASGASVHQPIMQGPPSTLVGSTSQIRSAYNNSHDGRGGGYGRPSNHGPPPSDQRGGGQIYTTRDMRMQPPTQEERRQYMEDQKRRNLEMGYNHHPELDCPRGGEHSYQATWELWDSCKLFWCCPCICCAALCQEVCICGDNSQGTGIGEQCFSPSVSHYWIVLAFFPSPYSSFPSPLSPSISSLLFPLRVRSDAKNAKSTNNSISSCH